MKYKMWTIRMLAAMLMMMCGFTLGGMSSHASTKSNMDKMVNNFCKAKYKKARKYNNKLPRYASESCVNKLPVKMKTAYRNTAKRISKKYGNVTYYLTDMDNDKKAELIINYYHGRDGLYMVYDYKGGKAVKLGSMHNDGFDKPVSYPGHKGLLMSFERKGIALYLYTFKNGKTKSKCLHDATYNYKITSQLPDYIRNELKPYRVNSWNGINGPLK